MRQNQILFLPPHRSPQAGARHAASPPLSFRSRRRPCRPSSLANARRPRKSPIRWRRQARHHRDTDWGPQPLSHHRQGSGAQVLGRRRPLRPAMVRHYADRQQTHQACVEAACVATRKALAGRTPQNPMGAAALVLVHNELAIHGTNNPGSIGGLVSAGCIRMHNRDVMDLYGRVKVGTRVVFVK
jgi:hypothetical protein